MEPAFWHSRWSEGRIGFHEGVPNEHLVRHLGRLAGKPRVFVPLCGKAEDLAFLASPEGGAHEVVGVELVEQAVKDFFAEHGQEPEVTAAGPLRRYQAGAVTVFAGDFFALTKELLGEVDALYDRAALIALPTPLRQRYVAHLRALLPTHAEGLIITVEYPQDRMGGPPFSVTEAEVRALWAGATLDELSDLKAVGARLGQVETARAKCYFLTS